MARALFLNNQEDGRCKEQCDSAEVKCVNRGYGFSLRRNYIMWILQRISENSKTAVKFEYRCWDSNYTQTNTDTLLTSLTSL